MSVHNEYTGYTLKHLLLRHMYNLSLLNLCADYCRMHTQSITGSTSVDCLSVTAVIPLHCTV